MNPIPAIMNWSGGKDSSLALHYVLQEKRYDVRFLLTTVNTEFQRISMHGVRRELLFAQAESLGMKLRCVMIPATPSMKEYDLLMHDALKEMVKEDIHHSIFGDIFLEDLRRYREQRLAELGMQGVFPLWKKLTLRLAKTFIALGFKAVIVCVNEKYLDASFVGRKFDQRFLSDLPESVDPCGENGEFHSFVYDGPIFHYPIFVKKGEVVHREYKKPGKNGAGAACPCSASNDWDTGFWYIDLLPKEKNHEALSR